MGIAEELQAAMASAGYGIDQQMSGRDFPSPW